jgi:hypothetical protein
MQSQPAKRAEEESPWRKPWVSAPRNVGQPAKRAEEESPWRNSLSGIDFAQPRINEMRFISDS